MSILHDMWTKDELDEELKNTYHYVFDLRSRLEDSAKLASANCIGVILIKKPNPAYFLVTKY